MMNKKICQVPVLRVFKVENLKVGRSISASTICLFSFAKVLSKVRETSFFH